jgi:hypothetical protein
MHRQPAIIDSRDHRLRRSSARPARRALLPLDLGPAVPADAERTLACIADVATTRFPPDSLERLRETIPADRVFLSELDWIEQRSLGPSVAGSDDL